MCHRKNCGGLAGATPLSHLNLFQQSLDELEGLRQGSWEKLPKNISNTTDPQTTRTAGGRTKTLTGTGEGETDGEHAPGTPAENPKWW